MPRALFLSLVALACSNATVDSGAFGGEAGGHGATGGLEGDGGGSGVGGVVFNEVVSSASETDDWFELFNATGATVALGGWGVTDDEAGGAAPWRFPAGATLPPGGFLVVWANDGDDPDALEADFKLSGSDGETLTLLDETDALRDEVAFPGLEEDTSWARRTDGTGDWAVSETPTPGSGND